MRGFTNKDRMVGIDAILPEEVFQELDLQAHNAATVPVQLRSLFPDWFNHPDIGWKQEYAYDVETDMSAAKITTLFGDLDTDNLINTRSTVKVVMIEKDFRIPRWTFENGSEDGYDVMGRNILAAARKVGEKEDAYLIMGWPEDGTNYQIPFQGLYEQANNDYSTSKDFGTNGYPGAAVDGGIALLEADYEYGPYNLILNPVQRRELSGSMDTYGNRELPIVNDKLNSVSVGKIGPDDHETKRVFSMPAMTAGDGLMIADDPTAFAVHPAGGLSIEIYDPSTVQGKFVSGRVMRREVLTIYRTNALCKLSNI